MARDQITQHGESKAHFKDNNGCFDHVGQIAASSAKLAPLAARAHLHYQHHDNIRIALSFPKVMVPADLRVHSCRGDN